MNSSGPYDALLPDFDPPSLIERWREKVAWWIHPNTSLEEAYESQREVDRAIREAHREADLGSEIEAKIHEVGQANHEFKQTLGGLFEPTMPEYNYAEQIAATGMLVIVAKTVIETVQKQADLPDDGECE